MSATDAGDHGDVVLDAWGRALGPDDRENFERVTDLLWASGDEKAHRLGAPASPDAPTAEVATYSLALACRDVVARMLPRDARAIVAGVLGAELPGRDAGPLADAVLAALAVPMRGQMDFFRVPPLPTRPDGGAA